MWTTAMFLLSVAGYQTGHAQRASRAVVPRPGQGLRFTTPDGMDARGIVTGVDPTTVGVTVKGRELRLGAEDLRGARVATGTEPATLKGLKMGALAGTAVGAGLGALAERNDDCGADCSYQGLAFAAGLALGAAAGSVIGAAIGSLAETPAWAFVAPPGGRLDGDFHDLWIGDGVRVIGTGSKRTGVVIGGAGDSVRVRLDTNEEIHVPVTSLERYVGERSQVGKGMLIGGALGLVFGAVSIATSDGLSQPTTAEAVGGAVLSGGLFAVIGGLIMNGSRPSWSRVTPERPRQVTIAPFLGPHHVGVVARLQL